MKALENNNTTSNFVQNTGGTDLMIWALMFGILVVVALVLAYMSRGMQK